jgi:hypothetical protein
VTALHFAAIFEKPESVQFLLTKAPKLWGDLARNAGKQIPMDFRILGDVKAPNALMFATSLNNLKSMKALLELDLKLLKTGNCHCDPVEKDQIQQMWRMSAVQRMALFRSTWLVRRATRKL